MKLIGNKGTIEITDDDSLIITYNTGHQETATMDKLDYYMQTLEIYSTADGEIQFGNWE